MLNLSNLITCWAYNQIIHAVWPEYDNSSNKRNFGMFDNKITLYKNATQTVLMEIRALTRKLLSFGNRDFYINITNPITNELLIRKLATVIDATIGRLSFIFEPSEIADISQGTYVFSISSIDEDGTEVFLFLDQSGGAAGDVSIADKPLPAFRPSQTTTSFSQKNIDAKIHYISTNFAGAGQYHYSNTQHTCAIYASNFTGQFFIDATLANDPGDNDWFPVVITDPYAFINMESFSGIETCNFYGAIQWIRFRYLPDSTNAGTIDKVVFRGMNNPAAVSA